MADVDPNVADVAGGAAVEEKVQGNRPYALEVMENVSYCKAFVEHMKRPFAYAIRYQKTLPSEKKALEDENGNPMFGNLAMRYLCWRKSLMSIGLMFLIFVVSQDIIENIELTIKMQEEFESNAENEVWREVFDDNHMIALAGKALFTMSLCVALAFNLIGFYYWKKPGLSIKWTRRGYLLGLIFPFILLLTIPYRQGIDLNLLIRHSCKDVVNGKVPALLSKFDSEKVEKFQDTVKPFNMTHMFYKANIPLPKTICDFRDPEWAQDIKNKFEDAGFVLDSSGSCPAAARAVKLVGQGAGLAAGKLPDSVKGMIPGLGFVQGKSSTGLASLASLPRGRMDLTEDDAGVYKQLAQAMKNIRPTVEAQRKLLVKMAQSHHQKKPLKPLQEAKDKALQMEVAEVAQMRLSKEPTTDAELTRNLKKLNQIHEDLKLVEVSAGQAAQGKHSTALKTLKQLQEKYTKAQDSIALSKVLPRGNLNLLTKGMKTWATDPAKEAEAEAEQAAIISAEKTKAAAAARASAATAEEAAEKAEDDARDADNAEQGAVSKVLGMANSLKGGAAGGLAGGVAQAAVAEQAKSSVLGMAGNIGKDIMAVGDTIDQIKRVAAQAEKSLKVLQSATAMMTSGAGLDSVMSTAKGFLSSPECEKCQVCFEPMCREWVAENVAKSPMVNFDNGPSFENTELESEVTGAEDVPARRRLLQEHEAHAEAAAVEEPENAEAEALAGETANEKCNVCSNSCFKDCAGSHISELMGSAMAGDVCLSMENLEAVDDLKEGLSAIDYLEYVVGAAYGLEALQMLFPASLAFLMALLKGTKVVKQLVPQARLTGWMIVCAAMVTLPTLLVFIAAAYQLFGDLWMALCFWMLICSFFTWVCFPEGLVKRMSHRAVKQMMGKRGSIWSAFTGAAGLFGAIWVLNHGKVFEAVLDIPIADVLANKIVEFLGRSLFTFVVIADLILNFFVDIYGKDGDNFEGGAFEDIIRDIGGLFPASYDEEAMSHKVDHFEDEPIPDKKAKKGVKCPRACSGPCVHCIEGIGKKLESTACCAPGGACGNACFMRSAMGLCACLTFLFLLVCGSVFVAVAVPSNFWLTDPMADISSVEIQDFDAKIVPEPEMSMKLLVDIVFENENWLSESIDELTVQAYYPRSWRGTDRPSFDDYDTVFLGTGATDETHLIEKDSKKIVPLELHLTHIDPSLASDLVSNFFKDCALKRKFPLMLSLTGKVTKIIQEEFTMDLGPIAIACPKPQSLLGSFGR